MDNYKDFDYILIDLDNIRPDNNKMVRSNFIRNVLEKIIERIYLEEFNYKIIVTSPLNRTLDKDEIGSFVGGNQPIYMSDLVVVLKGQIAKVIKNRNGSDGDYILYNTKQTVEI